MPVHEFFDQLLPQLEGVCKETLDDFDNFLDENAQSFKEKKPRLVELLVR